MKNNTEAIIDELIIKYPKLKEIRLQVIDAFDLMQTCYKEGGTILVCGNGGSAADADHIVGELMKGFHSKRPLTDALKCEILKLGSDGAELVQMLQRGIPAINLSTQTALITAIGNDIGYNYVFAQQIIGYKNPNNCLIGISTSGDSKNVINAGIVAKALGMKTMAMTGENGGMMKQLFDVVINVPENETVAIQELHLPIYHALCAMLEAELFEADF